MQFGRINRSLRRRGRSSAPRGRASRTLRRSPRRSRHRGRLHGEDGAISRASTPSLQRRWSSSTAGRRAVEIPLSSESGPRWSIYGAKRAQTAAIGRSSAGPENGSDKPIPPRTVALSCVHNEMVRRGSTVRVRQRALQRRRTSALSRSGRLALDPARRRYGAVYGAFASAAKKHPGHPGQSALTEQNAGGEVAYAGSPRRCSAQAGQSGRCE
jgi:hypothetical protein